MGPPPNLFVLVWLLVFAAAGCVRHRDVPVYCGFDGPDAASAWETAKFLPSAVEMQSRVSAR